MNARLDLDAYLERIAFEGSTAPTLDTAARLTCGHVESIPFENFDVLLGRGVRLDLESLQRKLVHDRRGGYCFEHATLLAAALEALGFAPRRHTARVVMYAPRETSPRTHMFLTVEFDGRTFVLDPGFGGHSARVPVPLLDGEPTQHGGDSHWMTRDGDVWTLRTRVAGEVTECWVSDMSRDNLIDFEVGNHYVATHPGSGMRNWLLLSAYRHGTRVSVMNREVTLRRGDETIKETLGDRSALRALVQDHFGFDLPEIERLRVPSIPEWS